ncbi:hypothetical protein G9A89_015686 [Geosiphon pyriformis]|nr:hypothetical protein G9A89_015686 [Geosiphon pyriformis]
MAIEEANHTKLVNLAIGETSSAAEEKIDQLTKKKRDCRKLQRDQQNRGNQHYSPPQQSYYQLSPPAYYPPRPQYQNNYYQPVPQPIQQQYQQPPTQYYQVPARRLITQNQFTPQNQYQVNNTNESPFLLSNAVANEQKAITAMYTEAEVEGKPICLILNSGSAGSIITYQLIQQLKRNVDRPAQIVIVTADGMKKTPVGEIDNFLFTLDGITISVKVLVMDAPQYQALVGNDWLQKANANLNWETQELTISYQGQHT